MILIVRLGALIGNLIHQCFSHRVTETQRNSTLRALARQRFSVSVANQRL